VSECARVRRPSRAPQRASPAHAYVRTHAYTYPARSLTHPPSTTTHQHARARTHTLTCTHARAHPHAHMHTCTHTQAQDEMEARARVVASNEHFVAFVPYAAICPFETWILPLRHQDQVPPRHPTPDHKLQTTNPNPQTPNPRPQPLCGTYPAAPCHVFRVTLSRLAPCHVLSRLVTS